MIFNESILIGYIQK